MAVINDKIVAWAIIRLGQKVGRGQCWDLVEQAITNSGGVSSGSLGPLGDDADYVWGSTITPTTSAISGDLLQFRNYSQTIKSVDKITYLDTDPPTYDTEDGGTTTLKYPHHSAIIESISGNKCIVLEQNVDPGGQTAQRSGAVYLADTVLPVVVSMGTRPLVDDKGKPLPPAKVKIERTTTITVVNPPKVYRAKTP